MTQMNQDGEGIDTQTYAIIGAAFEVHGQLGHGFLENVYQEALSCEFRERGITYRKEVELPVRYKGQILSCTYRADFLCFDSIIVELKALGELTKREHSQIINYLKATGLSRGLLLNFGTNRLEKKRFVFDPNYHRDPSESSVDELPS